MPVPCTNMSSESPLACPRCADVNLTKKLALRKKFRHWSCKSCKGVMLNVNDIKKLPMIGSRIIKKHKLENLLGSGDIGSLRCAACYANMSEIHVVCKKHDKHSHPVEKAAEITALTIVGVFVLFLAFILGPVADIAAYAAYKDSKKNAAKNEKKKKLKESEIEIITIDGCASCASFWFDEGEIQKLNKAKIIKDYSGINNLELEELIKKTEESRDNILGVTSKDSKIEWENISSNKKEEIKNKPLPEGKIVGKIIGKDTPSEGMMILNKKTNKWDFVPKSKDN